MEKFAATKTQRLKCKAKEVTVCDLKLLPWSRVTQSMVSGLRQLCEHLINLGNEIRSLYWNINQHATSVVVSVFMFKTENKKNSPT